MNWHQLEVTLGGIVGISSIILLVVVVLILLMGLTLKHLERFISKALKAEFTTRPGWLDLVLFFLFCVFIYGPPVAQELIEALKLAHLNSDSQLVNPNLKILCTLVAFLGSLLFVGLVSDRSLQPKQNRKKSRS